MTIEKVMAGLLAFQEPMATIPHFGGSRAHPRHGDSNADIWARDLAVRDGAVTVIHVGRGVKDPI
jgi:hypothetical protein